MTPRRLQRGMRVNHKNDPIPYDRRFLQLIFGERLKIQDHASAFEHCTRTRVQNTRLYGKKSRLAKRQAVKTWSQFFASSLELSTFGRL
ncbi:MAG: hypothetical protein MZV70_60930 [Desulfobacterales bacterium]|nr:hypothetical protein [Desulfobacterales bacterium]